MSRILSLFAIILLAAAAAAQERITRFVGFDGRLFVWSGNLAAIAVPSGDGFLEPVLSPEEAGKWADILAADGYDAKWSNFLAASKDFTPGQGDASLKSQILFKQVPEGARWMAVIPGRSVATASITSRTPMGIGSVEAALGGPSTVQTLASELGLRGLSGTALWQAMSQRVAERPHAVLLPGKQVVWLESLSPEDFGLVSAATGRPIKPPAKDSPPVVDKQSQTAGATQNPLWIGAAILFGLATVGLAVMIVIKAKQPPPEPIRVPVPNKEAEYMAAARKLQQSWVKVPKTDALSWLRDEAPQQLHDLNLSAAIGKHVMQRLEVADPKQLDGTLSELLDGENVHRALWYELGRATGVKASGHPKEISADLQQMVEDLQSRTAADAQLMIGLAQKAGISTEGAAPREALQLAISRLQKRATDAESRAAALEPSAKTLESLKPATALSDQIRQALHRARPAIADREVFAIAGYLLNYSLAMLQVATINQNESLRAAMLHNLKTISGALGQYEDSFLKLSQSIPSVELRLSNERHEDQADYLTLLQKALDLRNLRLSPFAIATDPSGAAYCVTTALA